MQPRSADPGVAGALDQLSMVTAVWQDHQVFPDVLSDWIEFLGGRPAEIVVVDCGSHAEAHETLFRLFRERRIDKLQLIHYGHHDQPKELCFIKEYTSGSISSFPYMLRFKSDTLPFRKGQDRWLAEAFDHLQRPEVFAIGGSFNHDARHHEAWPGWYYSHRCSENFMLLKRATWVDAMQEFAGPFISAGFHGHNPASETGQDRYLMEVAYERYIERHKKWTLVKVESDDFSIFHTNASGERLRSLREQYRARIGVHECLNAAGFTADLKHAAYYGAPPPPLIRRVREWFGTTALGAPWRRLKRAAGGAAL